VHQRTRVLHPTGRGPHESVRLTDRRQDQDARPAYRRRLGHLCCFAARNPISGRIEGFDADLARQVAKAIFGDSDKIQRRVITTAERIPVLQDGSVDLVISAMTINCARWQQVAFSAEYYRARSTSLRQG
jgi:ABC-type amino acid transport substrate-binding protein